jgi:hypothetical protein
MGGFCGLCGRRLRQPTRSILEFKQAVATTGVDPDCGTRKENKKRKALIVRAFLI